MRIGKIRAPDARPSPHQRIDHPHSHPGKRISIRSRRFVPRVPERWADVKAGFVHRGARRACRPRTQRWSGWVVEEVAVVGDLRGQVSASFRQRLDVLACPRCGRRLTLIALIEDPVTRFGQRYRGERDLPERPRNRRWAARTAHGELACFGKCGQNRRFRELGNRRPHSSHRNNPHRVLLFRSIH